MRRGVKANTYQWQVGGSNDVEHHWFLWRAAPLEARGYEKRGDKHGGVLVYRTKREATAALKALEEEATKRRKARRAAQPPPF